MITRGTETETDIAPTLTGYQSLGSIVLECSDEVFTDLGWAIFEIGGIKRSEVRGIISTYNDYATHVLVRLARARQPCRLEGLFSDGKTDEYRLILNDVVIENILVQDTTAIAGFRAVVPNPLPM